MRALYILVLSLLLVSPSFASKDGPFQTVTWPGGSSSPVLRFSFDRFKTLPGGVGKEHTYATETTAENLSDKTLGSVNVSIYAFDKNHTRIGDGIITLSNVGPHQMVRLEVTLLLTGTPASVAVAPTALASVSMTINSVPQGATVALDGKELGTTPKMADISLGKHLLTFSKEGYNTGKFPLEIGSRDANGGSVSYELGTSAHDTIELRDGSVLSGDLLSINALQVQIRIGGMPQTYDRNQVKRISLVERDPVPE